MGRMWDLSTLFQAHGVLAVSLALFLKRMGVPIPAFPFLLLVGAQSAGHGALALSALAGATSASMLADTGWFLAGRRYGRAMLGLMCRISMSPGTCIRRSELTFAKRGDTTVLLAKFIPGVAGLTPPLAGALGMQAGRFTVLNLVGTLLWTGAGLAAGLLFYREVMQGVGWGRRLGAAALPFVAALVGLYLAWLVARRALATRATNRAPRIAARELAERLARGEDILLVDVRGADLLPSTRLPGAMHAPLGSEAFDRLAALPGRAELVTYCDCPNDVSAARAALDLARRGLAVRVLSGGFEAWRAAGLPVDAAAKPLPQPGIEAALAR
jgi:membrane protein DedA with SNARE-associated domain/rhodanese-related sulfurtransferase